MGKMVESEIMRRTVRKVFDTWDRSYTWGWNYPMAAMTAAAMMAAGWDGTPDKHTLGLPDNESWIVPWEGLKPLP